MSEKKSFYDSLEIVEGQHNRPYVGLIYGVGGSGKSHLAGYAEDPLFIPLESGIDFVKGKQFPVIAENISQTFDMIRYIAGNTDICKTVIIDSLPFFQTFAYAQVIIDNPKIMENGASKTVKSIADYGFQSGYGMAMAHWNRLIAGVDLLQKKGLNVILICHSQLKNEKLPNGDTYKKIGFNLHNGATGDVCELLRRRVDWCLYMEMVDQTQKQGGGKFAKNVAVTGTRPDVIVHTRPTSSYFAKVREKVLGSTPDYFLLDASSQETIDATSSHLMKTIAEA